MIYSLRSKEEFIEVTGLELSEKGILEITFREISSQHLKCHM